MIIPANQLAQAMRIFRIPNRTGQVVPFRLNDAQQTYIARRSNFDVIYKSRQFGFSSFLELEGTILCARYPQQHAVVIAHDRESTQRLFKRTKFFLEDVARLGMAIPYRTYSKNEIVFTETNSTFYVGTAGSRKFGRGDTINFLHCSEVAFWPNATETMGGLVPAAKYGRISLESTANGKGGYFHSMCVKALKDATEEVHDGFAKYIRKPKLHFYPWHHFSEYQIPGEYDKGDLTDEETELVLNFGLTLPQIAWRRQTMEEMPKEMLFPQEYPMTFDEGFLASGHGYFPTAHIIPAPSVTKRKHIEIWSKPVPGRTYIAGIDTGGGTRNDYSVVEIFDAESLEQVAEYAANDVSPKTFALEARELCLEYKAYVCIEVQYGLITLEIFKDKYPRNLMYKRVKADKVKYEETQELLGYYATRTSKHRVCAKGRAAIDEGAILHSSFLNDQLGSFVETPEGELQGEEGCHDDAVIAFCLAIEALSSAKIKIHRASVPECATDVFKGYSFKSIRDRIVNARKGYNHL